jgi:hypothetical protein
MKKWLIRVVFVFILFLIGSYFFIPKKIFVTKSITANANQTGVYRFLSDESNWQKWWPGSSSINKDAENVFESGGYRFKKTKLLYNSFEISIEKDKSIDSSLLHIFLPGNDSIKIEWNATINTGTNPFSKIRHYFKAKQLSNSLAVILTALQKHISNVKHIYGVDIKKEKVKIEYLVSTKKSFGRYPTTEDIYEMINQIKKNIIREQAKEEDYPMLNIKASDSTHFEAQVAIPVNKKLPDTDIFSTKRMLKNGNILVAEISGGKNKTDSAMKKFDLYVSDYQYSNIAIPFHSLVTDRMKEPDTSKWMTRIYYPVM